MIFVGFRQFHDSFTYRAILLPHTLNGTSAQSGAPVTGPTAGVGHRDHLDPIGLDTSLYAGRVINTAFADRAALNVATVCVNLMVSPR